jgi:hypothetical protein
MKRSLAIRRWAGLGVAWDAADPEPEPLQAVAAPAPLVNLTVIVQSGAVLSIGGAVIDPRLIPAVPQTRAAITEGTGERQLSDNGNGGAIGVTDDRWAEQKHGSGEGK